MPMFFSVLSYSNQAETVVVSEVSAYIEETSPPSSFLCSFPPPSSPAPSALPPHAPHNYRVLLFSATCLLVLSPQKLLEFRYFIIPHIMLRLHLPPSPSPLPLLLEAGLYLAINTLTVWMFLYKPFHWSGDNRVQRFMW